MFDSNGLRLVLTLGGGVLLTCLLFWFASRLIRGAQRRLVASLEAIVTGSEGGYRDAPSRFERSVVETTPRGPRLRFAFRDQRGLLEFAAPTASASATRSFGGFRDDGSARTELRFWIRSTRETRFDLDGDPSAGPWHPDAHAHLENLRTLGQLRGVAVAVTADGLFIVKPGWLGLSPDTTELKTFLDEACALVALHLEERLFDASSTM